MNKPLRKAMDEMLELFKKNSLKIFSMQELIKELGKTGNQEPEVRAAFWCLMSDQEIDYDSRYKGAKLKN